MGGAEVLVAVLYTILHCRCENRTSEKFGWPSASALFCLALAGRVRNKGPSGDAMLRMSNCICKWLLEAGIVIVV